MTGPVVATLLCDRKAASQMVALPAIAELEGVSRIYVNVETAKPHEIRKNYGEMLDFRNEVMRSGRIVDVDVWQCVSTWRPQVRYDQDQRRLIGICMGRNMARQYAMTEGASHLMFVDSDVVPAPDGLMKLLELEHPIVGGLVPGRGAHSHVQYLFHNFPVGDPRRRRYVPPSSADGFPDARMEEDEPDDPQRVAVCAHATLGYSLIERKVLSTLAFRSGLSREDLVTPLSEDPAFASDAYLNGFGRWWVDLSVRAGHWDDPANPFVEEAASRDNEIPI